MSKIFKTLFFIFLLFLVQNNVFSADIKIISRQEWGADESYRYLDSESWQKIIEKWKNTPKKELSEYQKKKAKIESEKVKKANNFLVENYSDKIGIKKIIREENGHKLAWPLAYSKKKVAIVIHHTDSDVVEGDDNYEVIRKIYKYHAINRAWGDIGYNYLIGTNGEIFEGRAGGDFVIGAHDKWNNQSTIGISLIGNFNNKKASKKQIESLKKLIKYLQKKYNINFNKKQDFFKWCVGTSKECQKNPLIVKKYYPLIGHRDAGHTACPGEKLYKQLQEIKKEFKVGLGDDILTNKQKILLNKIKQKIQRLNEYENLKLLAKIETLIDKNIGYSKFLKELKKSIFDKVEYNKNFKKQEKYISFDDNNKIKVKLSYPKNDKISFELPRDLKLDFIKNNKEYILNFLNSKKSQNKNIELDFEFKNNKLFIKNKELIDFSKIKFLRIKTPKDKIITISSWDRKKSWDKSGKINDNKFRGDIILYSKNGKLIVVNELYLNDYLKGLGEVSNSTNQEKVKTIIILARTYARWYMTKARKFIGEWYDASDDPNIFQKYLGYSLEQRSPKVNKIVEETKDLVVTYNGDLIKPWYFSSSNGKTISFLEYCKKANGIPDCAHPEKFPFLVGVSDPGGIGKRQAGHGVGASGTGIEYFSQKGWNFNMIIKYFFKGVEIERK